MSVICLTKALYSYLKKHVNRLEIYKILKENNGYLTIEEGQTYTATVVVEDFKGNATSVNIPIKGERLELKTERPENKGNKQLIAKRDNYYELSKGSVFFPENTFYEDLAYQHQRRQRRTAYRQSTHACR